MQPFLWEYDNTDLRSNNRSKYVKLRYGNICRYIQLYADPTNRLCNRSVYSTIIIPISFDKSYDMHTCVGFCAGNTYVKPVYIFFHVNNIISRLTTRFMKRENPADTMTLLILLPNYFVCQRDFLKSIQPTQMLTQFQNGLIWQEAYSIEFSRIKTSKWGSF